MRTLESLLDDEFGITDSDVFTILQDHWYCDIAEMDGIFCNACLSVINYEMTHGNLARMDFPGVICFNKVKCKKPYGWGGINPLRTRLICYIKYLMTHAHMNKDSVEYTIRDICGDKVPEKLVVDFKETNQKMTDNKGSFIRRKIIIKVEVTADRASAMYGNTNIGHLRLVFTKNDRSNG